MDNQFRTLHSCVLKHVGCIIVDCCMVAHLLYYLSNHGSQVSEWGGKLLYVAAYPCESALWGCDSYGGAIGIL